jgi:hypothetical protein
MPFAINDALNLTVTPSESKTVTLFNAGLAVATGLTLPSSDSHIKITNGGANGENACNSTLAINGICKFTIASVATINSNKTIHVNYADGSGIAQQLPINVIFSAVTPAPGLTLEYSTPSLTYVPVAPLTTVSTELTIINSSTTATTLSNLTLSPAASLAAGFSYDNTGLVGSICATNGTSGGINQLSPGESCTINLNYTPTVATTGIEHLTIAVSGRYSDPLSGAAVSISNTSTSLQYSAITSNANLSFSSLASLSLLANGEASAAENVTVTNSGGYAADNISYALASVPAGNVLTLDSGDCGTSLASGSSCTMTINYAPTLVYASGTAQIRTNYDASPRVAGQQATTDFDYLASLSALIRATFVGISGNVVGSEPNYSFVPTVNNSVTLTYNYQNSGSAAATNFYILPDSLPVGTVTSGSCLNGLNLITLQANDSCTLTINYVSSSYLNLINLSSVLSGKFKIPGYSYSDETSGVKRFAASGTELTIDASPWENSVASVDVNSQTKQVAISFTLGSLGLPSTLTAQDNITFALRNLPNVFSYASGSTCTIPAGSLGASCMILLNYTATTPLSEYGINWVASRANNEYVSIVNYLSFEIQ